MPSAIPPTGDDGIVVRVDIARQQLRLMQDGGTVASYPVSTAANGPGERHGSECYQRTLHRYPPLVDWTYCPGQCRDSPYN